MVQTALFSLGQRHHGVRSTISCGPPGLVGGRTYYVPSLFGAKRVHGFDVSQRGFNKPERRGALILWTQIVNAKRLGLRTICGAVRDELSDGFCGALLSVVERKRSLPQSGEYQFAALDEDGYDCPPGWLAALPHISQSITHLTGAHWRMRSRIITRIFEPT